MSLAEKLIPISVPKKASSESFTFCVTTSVTAALYAIFAILIGSGQYLLGVECDFEREKKSLVDKYCARHLYVEVGPEKVPYFLDFYPWMALFYLMLAVSSIIPK